MGGPIAVGLVLPAELDRHSTRCRSTSFQASRGVTHLCKPVYASCTKAYRRGMLACISFVPIVFKMQFLYNIVYFQKTLNCESLSEVELLIHLLTILARNLDNIPLVASCDYVSISIGIAATVIHQVNFFHF